MKLKVPAGWSRGVRAGESVRSVGNCKVVGDRGEAIAATYYESMGYEVLAKNWRTREGELDLVVRQNETLVFVEVRTRSREGYIKPTETVNGEKQRRVVQQARLWMSAHEAESEGMVVEFEVVGVVLSTGSIERIEDAIEVE